VLKGGRKERVVHLGAVAALKVVEADDRDLCRGIAADGAAGHVDRKERVVGQVELVQTGQRFAIGLRSESQPTFSCAVRERDGQRVIAGNLAWRARAKSHIEIWRHVVLGADHNFDAAVQCQVLGCLRGGLGFAAHGQAQCEQASQKVNT